MTKKLSIADYARIYTQRYGWHLVPIEPLRKFPTATDWGNIALSEPAQAFAFWELHKDWNMGAALWPSEMCSLDIDDAEGFSTILEEFGIPESDLDIYPTIKGKGKRIMFRVPEGVNLPYCKVNWPKKEDQKKHFTVFELRSATDGSQKQDVLPPSIHPETLAPYEWLVKPPKTIEEWPEPPDWLIAIWQAWDDFKPQLVDACPWREREPRPIKKRVTAPQNSDIPDISGEYCKVNDIKSQLVTYGYIKKGKRYLSPHSGTGLPGVCLFDEVSCWIHHASDPLCSEESGQPVNSYDLFRYYECNNDPKEAFKKAAEILGIDIKRQATPKKAIKPPATTDTQTDIVEGRNITDILPHCNDKGKPVAHIENLKEICKRLGVVIRYNVITKEEEILIPGKAFSRDNEGNASLAWLESECSLFTMPTSKLTGFITYLADMNQYNPVVEWVSSKPWDGVDRLQLLLDTVKLTDESEQSIMLRDTLIKRWMVSAIAGAFSPDGVSAAGVLTFQGDQYLGKTKWFKSLVPKEKNLVKDGFILRPDDRDSVKQCLAYWLVELGELDSTFRRADISALKAFLTQQDDVLRVAYAKRESKFVRRTVFFGSVNPKVFLYDPTGNRRYWTIEAAYLDHTHDLDMQQVWAQVWTLYDTGFGYYLTAEEMEALNKHNEGFTAADPVEEVLSTHFDWESNENYWKWFTSTDILKAAGFDRPTKADVNSCANLIRKLNGNRTKRSGGARLLLVPPSRIA